MAYNNGKFSKAISKYKRAADQGDLEGYLNLAIIFKDLGYHSLGIKFLRQAFSKFSADTRILPLLARLYYLNNQPDRAIGILKKISLIKPDDLDTYISLGFCYQDKNADTEAQKYFAKAISLDKNSVLAHLSLADLYLRQQKLTESAQEYKTVSMLDASIQRIYKYWAEILFTMKAYKDAFRVYEKISLLEPNNRLAGERLEQLRTQLGQEYFLKEREKRILAKAEKMVFVKSALTIKNMVFVKVGLIQTESKVELKCSSDYQIITKNGGILLTKNRAGENCLISKTAHGNIIVEMKGGKNLIVDEDIIIRALNKEGTITLFSVKFGKDNFWSGRQDRSYRGQIETNIIAKGLNFVNKVSLEEYLYGVVPSEMPSNWPLEALKAQAVAARSEAMVKLGRHKEEGFDFCSEVHCQVYGGVENESLASNQAVEQTQGIIMSYADKAVDAIYSSCCGGHTQDNIFGKGQDIPYLKGVPDTVSSQGLIFPLSPMDLESWFRNPSSEILCNIPQYSATSNFRWVRIYSPEEVKEMLRGVADLGDISKIIVLKRQRSGHINTIKIIGTKSSYIIEKELNIRKILGNLRSSMFKIELKLSKDARPQQFVFYGGGWGHGAGMCQAGACGMAKQGKDYKQILRHYYRGVEFKKIY
jgi:SpoIID/LytB domain protein